MNGNDIKWITANSLNLNNFYFSIPEKLDKFGYCVDFSGYGEGKLDKAQISILDVAKEKEKPNILIICPQGSKQSWYTALLTGLGLDFKFVNGGRDTIMFFAPEMSNLLIVDEKVLKDGDNSAYGNIRKSGIVWDLLIIDASGAIDGMEPELYTDCVGMKADKLLIFAPYPSEYTQSPDGIKAVVKTLLSSTAMAEGIDSYPIDKSVMEFTMEAPYADYPAEEDGEHKVTTISYSFNEKDIPKDLHIDEISSGGAYSHGGNIFEEYNLEERKTYLKPVYTRSDAETLKNKDKKLQKFLEVIDGVINSEDKLAVVYFESEATVSYIEKILSAIYFDKTENMAYYYKTRFDVKRLKQIYEILPERKLKVILTTDKLGEVSGIMGNITHIINYELPDNPVMLQQRFMRRSPATKTQPEFIIFMDENGLFDSRILGKALCGNLYKAYRQSVPSENILMNVEGIEKILTDMLIDIKYIADYTGEVGSSFDVIARFKQEYNIPQSRNLTTGAKTHEYAKRKLEVLASILGVKELLSVKDVDRDALCSAIAAKVKEIREGFAYYDENMNIHTVPRLTARTKEFKEFSSYLSGNPINLGLEGAKKSLKNSAGDGKKYAKISDAVSEISDALKPAVLYNAWYYWHKDLGIGGSYDKFIEEYNKGVI